MDGWMHACMGKGKDCLNSLLEGAQYDKLPQKGRQARIIISKKRNSKATWMLEGFVSRNHDQSR